MNDQMNGHGKYFLSDGRCYEGQFLDDQKEGFGIFKWPNGDKFEGN